MMPDASDVAIFPVPAPSPIIGAVLAIGYAVLLLGLDGVLPTIDPRFSPVAALGGVLVYALALWAIDRRDPRLWRDRARFADYVSAWATAAGAAMPDESAREQLRARSWHDAGVAMAQQAGAVAGAGAGITVSDHGWPLTIIVFGGTMVLVGLLVRRWLMLNEQATLGPLVKRG